MTTAHKRVLYALFSLTLLLILLMAACDLLSSTRLLPDSVIPAEMATVTSALRNMALMLGLLAGGVTIALNSDPQPPSTNLLRILWFHSRHDGLLRVWASGLLVVIVSSLLAWRFEVAWWLRLTVGYMLMALPVAFWLMLRVSNVQRPWVLRGLRSTVIMLTVAGLLLSLAQVTSLSLLLLWVPIAYGIFAAHSYRALSDRNPTRTLTAPWLVIGVLLLILMSVLAGVLSLASVQPYLVDTTWPTLQSDLMYYALIAWVLALLNQGAAELRGQNRRVTGYVPLWTISAGMFGGSFALALMSIVQSYGLHIYGIPAETVAQSVLPLAFFVVGGKLLVAIGLGIYGVQFQVRRVRIRET
ncbi:MAG: hypothetical protein CL607_09190 [Anaerolineaceae bacterium]|nr:hypothetical protein [Anaerolineaceae bacterium]